MTCGCGVVNAIDILQSFLLLAGYSSKFNRKNSYLAIHSPKIPYI